jgi:hypothetical protein
MSYNIGAAFGKYVGLPVLAIMVIGSLMPDPWNPMAHETRI